MKAKFYEGEKGFYCDMVAFWSGNRNGTITVFVGRESYEKKPFEFQSKHITALEGGKFCASLGIGREVFFIQKRKAKKKGGAS